MKKTTNPKPATAPKPIDDDKLAGVTGGDSVSGNSTGRRGGFIPPASP